MADANAQAETLNDEQWEIAHKIARQLVLNETDVNEFKKAISYLRLIVDKDAGAESAGKQFFDYLKLLAREGDSIGHSKRTIDYYRSIGAVCDEHISSYKNEGHTMLRLLGWAARFVKYYKEMPVGEVTNQMSERQRAVAAAQRANQLSLGQKIEATVTAIKGNKVTYEIMNTVKLTQKEPKHHKKLSIGQTVDVEVIQMKDMKTVKKVRLVTQ